MNALRGAFAQPERGKAPSEKRDAKPQSLFKLRPVFARVTVDTLPGLVCGECKQPLTLGQLLVVKKVAEQNPSDLVAAWHYPKCTPKEIAEEL